MRTYLLRTKPDEITYEYAIHEVQSVVDVSDKQMLRLCQKAYPQHNFIECKQLTKERHICKYCGWVAEGEYEDLLCEDCRRLFGHATFSEL